jgi:hypothetical protein
MWIGHRQRLQHDGVDQREDGGVRYDAQRLYGSAVD